MKGKKLQGGYALIRTKLGAGKQWLLLKMNDEHAVLSGKQFPHEHASAKTSRTMEQITKEEGDPSMKKVSKKIEKTITLNRRTIQLTNTEKVLFPATKITKGQLIDYYVCIATYMLPYVKNRAVTMHRFPDGIRDEGFYQKDISEYFPSWIKRVVIPKEGGKNTYVVCNNAATLAYLANQACITLHIWLSRIDKLDYPDRMIFDLDPGNSDFTLVRTTARELHDLLETLGLTSFVMTTGSRGIHIVVPLDRRSTFDEVRVFARTISDYLAQKKPKQLTTEARLNKRRSRLYIDASRNAFAQTGVAPYSVRAKEGASVATPLAWDELDKIKTAQCFTIKSVFKRLEEIDDPWQGFITCKQSLKKAQRIFERIKNT